MTQEQIALLNDELSTRKYDGKTSREIARMLSTRPYVPNPVTAAKIPAPFTADDLKNIVSTLPEGVQVELVNIIAEQDHSKLEDYGTFGGRSLAAIAARVIDDPSHQVTIRGDSPLMTLGITEIKWDGMTFINSIPRDAVEDVQNG